MTEKTKRKIKIDSPRKEVVKYLESRGWKIVVIGEHGVLQNPDDRKFNYTYYLRFTGIKEVSV